MKKLVIPIHSFVDVITNSSTTIYVGCHSNTIEYAKDLINNLLKIAGSDKKADDLFEFEIQNKFQHDRELLEEYLDCIIDDYEDEIRQDERFKDIEDINDVKDDIYDQMIKMVADKMLKGEIELIESNDYGYDERKLVITAKTDDKIILNLSDKMSSIFEIDGTRDG